MQISVTTNTDGTFNIHIDNVSLAELIALVKSAFA